MPSSDVNYQCCDWDHVRPCGPVPGNKDKSGEEVEPICACGCSGYDERCGGGAWWLPEAVERAEGLTVAEVEEALRPW
jgi:hypothetical protein